MIQSRYVALMATFWMLCLFVGTIVRDAPLDDLALNADVIVHATVSKVDDRIGEIESHQFQTQVILKIEQSLKGLSTSQQELTLLLPGGFLGGRSVKIPGMPHFKPADEVVLLLERNPKGELVLEGMSLGVFYIRRPLNQPKSTYITRNLNNLMLVQQQHQTLPTSLEELLAQLRRFGGEKRP